MHIVTNLYRFVYNVNVVVNVSNKTLVIYPLISAAVVIQLYTNTNNQYTNMQTDLKFGFKILHDFSSV